MGAIRLRRERAKSDFTAHRARNGAEISLRLPALPTAACLLQAGQASGRLEMADVILWRAGRRCPRRPRRRDSGDFAGGLFEEVVDGEKRVGRLGARRTSGIMVV